MRTELLRFGLRCVIRSRCKWISLVNILNRKEARCILSDIRHELTICPYCHGQGWTEEHHYACQGECFDCPIQEQCDKCEATGIVWKKDLETEKNTEIKTDYFEDDLPF